MKYILAFIAVLMSTSVTYANQNKVLFQAGSIEAGQQVTITPTSGVASYYQDGISGSVTFTCQLSSTTIDKEVKAILVPGKNFSNPSNPSYTALAMGLNGPYTWSLTNTGEANGNIKIFLLSETPANLQCQGTYIPASY
jgi:hypothetical protein